MSNKQITNKIQDTINVGNLGTNPVFIYSISTGITSIAAIIKISKDIILKNNPGLYSLNKVAIVFITFTPSLYVFNLDMLPSGLSLY